MANRILPSPAVFQPGERVARLDEVSSIDELPSMPIHVPTWSTDTRRCIVLLRALSFAEEMQVAAQAKGDADLAALWTVRYGMKDPALTDEHVDTLLKTKRGDVIRELATFISGLGALDWQAVDELAHTLAGITDAPSGGESAATHP